VENWTIRTRVLQEGVLKGVKRWGGIRGVERKVKRGIGGWGQPPSPTGGFGGSLFPGGLRCEKGGIVQLLGGFAAARKGSLQPPSSLAWGQRKIKEEKKEKKNEEKTIEMNEDDTWAECWSPSSVRKREIKNSAKNEAQLYIPSKN